MKQKWLFFFSVHHFSSRPEVPGHPAWHNQIWPLRALNEVTASGFPGRKFTGNAMGGVLSFLRRMRSCKWNPDAGCKGRNQTLAFQLFEEQDKPVTNFSSCVRIDGVLTRYTLIQKCSQQLTIVTTVKGPWHFTPGEVDGEFTDGNLWNLWIPCSLLLSLYSSETLIFQFPVIAQGQLSFAHWGVTRTWDA